MRRGGGWKEATGKRSVEGAGPYGGELLHMTGSYFTHSGVISFRPGHSAAHPPPERDVMGASGEVRYERRGTCGRPASHFHTCPREGGGGRCNIREGDVCIWRLACAWGTPHFHTYGAGMRADAKGVAIACPLAAVRTEDRCASSRGRTARGLPCSPIHLSISGDAEDEQMPGSWHLLQGGGLTPG